MTNCFSLAKKFIVRAGIGPTPRDSKSPILPLYERTSFNQNDYTNFIIIYLYINPPQHPIITPNRMKTINIHSTLET